MIRSLVAATLATTALAAPAPAFAQDGSVCPSVSYVASAEDKEGPPDVPVTIEGGSDVQPAKTPDRWTLTRVSPGPEELVDAVEASPSFSFTFTVAETTTFRIDAVGPAGCDGASGTFTRTVTGATPSPTPAQTPHADCAPILEPVPAVVPAWGLDGRGGVTIAARGPEAGAELRINGYTRPSTEHRVLGRAETDESGVARIPLPIQGSTRLSAFGGGCVFSSQQVVVTVQARLGSLTARRNAPRDYTFSAFYAGPAGKIGNLYRVLPDGRAILTSQTRMGGEFVSIRRLFLGSGRFGFVLRTGNDVTSLGASTDVRDTLIH